MSSLHQFIEQIPKAELHLHIEGSLEPEMMMMLAERNGVPLPYKSVEDIQAAYQFTDLQSFLNIYYQGAGVLQTEQDFYDMTMAYLERAHGQNVRHTEIFFDPQTHTERGIAFDVVIRGIHAALEDAERKMGLTTGLICCFLRHLPERNAFDTYVQAIPYREWIKGFGLDSSEKDYPPQLFARVFEEARGAGFSNVAHAGEEGPAQFIWDALTILQVKRIDHGVRCEEDEELMEFLAETEMPLTVCPLSNVKLRVFDTMADHNIIRLLERGIKVTVNSDDPAYFGGYVNENFKTLAMYLPLTKKHIYDLCRHSFEAAFLPTDIKAQHLSELDFFYATHH